MPRADEGSWTRYLDEFHAERPGITEDTLARARSGATTPYGWLVEPLGIAGPVLDLACGSAPLLAGRGWTGWVGADLSAAELSRARARGATRLVRADAAGLPIATGSCRQVVCSMAIMVLQPLDAVLGELRRVLHTSGVAALLLPGTLPVTPHDVARYGRLMLAVRRARLTYPNDRLVGRLPDRLGAAGLTVIDDRRRRFALPIADAAMGRLFVRSLYLPDVPPARVEVAAQVAAGWAGSDIGIPLRRLVIRGT